MTRNTTTFAVQVPARRVREALPAQLHIGSDTLEIGTQSAAGAEFYGQQTQRYRASWSRGPAAGKAYVEIRATSKLTSEIIVALQAPAGPFGRLWWTGQRLHRLATLFAQALRYEIETRATEEADGFDVRRTSAELVRARIA